MKIVVDTNVVISGTFFKGKPREIIEAIGDILPPPTLTFRGGGFSVKNTSVFRLPELIGFPVPQGTLLVFT